MPDRPPSARTTPTVATGPDPSGVPRPIDPSRIIPAKENSGVLVGSEPVQTPAPQASTAQPDQYKTAFVKVYQDAGVIGVAMLTLLALCVVMAIFSGRVLKMYSTLVTANTDLIKTSADATIKIATAMNILQSTLVSAMADMNRENDDRAIGMRDISTRLAAIENKADVMFSIRTQGVSMADRQYDYDRVQEKKP